MRIIGGALRGRPLAAPAGATVRPTSDRAREAVFNILTHAGWAPSLEGARVIDLFAGAGALGLEALSRGAAFCLFVETSEEARGAIRRNIDTLDLFGQTRIHRRDATQLGPKPASAGAPFTLAFMDPPYDQGLGERALGALQAGGWLAADALIVYERSAKGAPEPLEGVEIVDQRIWGAAEVVFARLRS